VVVKKETAERRDESADSRSSATNDSNSPLEEPRAGETSESGNATMTKRVRNLECRPTQRLVSDSWLSRLLRWCLSETPGFRVALAYASLPGMTTHFYAVCSRAILCA